MADLEKVAAQVANMAWSRLVNEAAARYAETTGDEDDTSERWHQFRVLVVQKLAAKVAGEQERLGVVAGEAGTP